VQAKTACANGVFPLILNKDKMKHSQNGASPEAQKKTLLVMVSSMAGSLVLAGSVVSVLIKLLSST
jgi:hypothetical protein